MSRSVTEPALTPGDPHVGALDDAEGVVHLDLVGVGVVGAGGRGEAGDRGGEQAEDQRDPPHGPGCTSLGSQSPGSPSVSAPPSVNGTESSAGSMSPSGRSLPPGQRRVLPVSSAAASSVGGQRVEQVRDAAGTARR